MPRTLLLLLCLLPALLHAAPATQSFEGRVVAVADGDTLTVLDSNNLQHKIRVAGIDAPEKGQPFGDRSKQSLSRAVMGRTFASSGTSRTATAATSPKSG
jgi:endonuclease YncB( thermonuclease family)